MGATGSFTRGVRCDCCVKIMHACPSTREGDGNFAPGGGGPAAGGIVALASRTCVPCVPCACRWGARPAVRAELGGRGSGQAQTMAPGHRTTTIGLPGPAPARSRKRRSSTWFG